MTKSEEIADFLALKKLAIVGVSAGGKKFGNAVLKNLREKGYTVYPINRKGIEINGEPTWSDLSQLPEKPEGVVAVVPPAETEKIVRQAKELGITKIWMQPGAESKEAIGFCRDNKMTAIHGQCIMMHAEPVKNIHGFHRWLWKLFGKLPA